MKHHWKTALFVMSGAVPLLGLLSRPPDVMLLLYTLFVGVCISRPWMVPLLRRVPCAPSIQLLAAFLVSGFWTEGLAWLNNYLKAAREPALFHPQLLADLIIGIGFYGGWAAGWWIALRWFRFQLWETFVITGLQGIFFEQLGAVFQMMIRVWSSNPLQSLLFGLYVFAVHGSAVGLALALVLPRYQKESASRSWVRIPLVVVLMVGFAFAGCWLIGLIANALGGLPPKRSITEHPLW